MTTPGEVEGKPPPEDFKNPYDNIGVFVLKDLPPTNDLKEDLQSLYESSQEGYLATLGAVKHLEDIIVTLGKVKSLLQDELMGEVAVLKHRQGLAAEDHTTNRRSHSEAMALLESIERVVTSLQDELMDHRELKGLMDSLDRRLDTLLGQRQFEGVLDALQERLLPPEDMELVVEAAKKALDSKDDPWYKRAYTAFINKFWDLVMGAVLILILKSLIPIIWSQSNLPPPQPQPQVQTQQVNPASR